MGDIIDTNARTICATIVAQMQRNNISWACVAQKPLEPQFLQQLRAIKYNVNVYHVEFIE